MVETNRLTLGALTPMPTAINEACGLSDKSAGDITEALSLACNAGTDVRHSCEWFDVTALSEKLANAALQHKRERLEAGELAASEVTSLSMMFPNVSTAVPFNIEIPMYQIKFGQLLREVSQKDVVRELADIMQKHADGFLNDASFDEWCRDIAIYTGKLQEAKLPDDYAEILVHQVLRGCSFLLAKYVYDEEKCNKRASITKVARSETAERYVESMSVMAELEGLVGKLHSEPSTGEGERKQEDIVKTPSRVSRLDATYTSPSSDATAGIPTDNEQEAPLQQCRSALLGGIRHNEAAQ